MICISLFARIIGITGLFVQYGLALPSPTVQNEPRTDTSLSSFISSESPIALKGILDNIGPDGAKVPGAGTGLVIASPSRTNPNYFFTWTRDSALTFKILVDTFIAGDKSLQRHIQDYVNAQAKLQTVDNPAGGLANGRGLGEAKFEANGTAFLGGWGRPQHDGPALRATALITYSKWLLANGEKSVVTRQIWPVIRNDLAYVGQYWSDTGFDLWEEVEGSSFFTTAVQHRALVEGAGLARRIGRKCPACSSQAPQVLCFLQKYWNGTYIVANFPTNDNGRSAIDANTLLGSIHTFDPNAACDDSTFQPCSAKALANHKLVTDSFRKIYKINSGIGQGSAVAVGRYKEDVYNGSPTSGLGNPWYLNTLAAAEQLYDALYQWEKLGSLTVTSISLEFFRDFAANSKTGTYKSNSATYKLLTARIRRYADGYVRIVQKYTPSDGALSEQFSRDDGKPLSAVDLTWSYASFLTVIARRAGKVPTPWGESIGKTVPRTCATTSANGRYVPAIRPAVCTKPVPATVALTFNVLEATVFGQNVFVTGSLRQLGFFNESNSVPLSANTFTGPNPRWYATVNVPAGTKFDYRYFVKEADGTIKKERRQNRRYRVPRRDCDGDVWIFDEFKN